MIYQNYFFCVCQNVSIKYKTLLFIKGNILLIFFPSNKIWFFVLLFDWCEIHANFEILLSCSTHENLLFCGNQNFAKVINFQAVLDSTKRMKNSAFIFITIDLKDAF